MENFLDVKNDETFTELHPIHCRKQRVVPVVKNSGLTTIVKKFEKNLKESLKEIV